MKKFIFAVMLLLVPLSSHALFEVRAGYGTHALDDDTYSESGITLISDDGAGFNIDVIFEPPLITDLGIGLRYEVLKYDFRTTPVALTGEVEMTRLAGLINYRIIDFFAYLGLIGTFDIDNKSKVTLSNTTTEDDMDFMWSAGVEGGVNLGLFSVGAEVGKMFGDDMDGLYGKVLFGVGF